MNRWYARRPWIYGGLVLLLALDAGVYFGWVRRPALPPEAAKLQAAELRHEVARHQAEVQRLERIRAAVPDLQPKLARFSTDHFLSEATGYSSVAADLGDAASKTGVQLQKVSYKPATAQEQESKQFHLVRIEISTQVQGDYVHLLRYLEALEQSPRFYLISRLGLVEVRRGQLSLEMSLATYFKQGAS